MTPSKDTGEGSCPANKEPQTAIVPKESVSHGSKALQESRGTVQKHKDAQHFFQAKPGVQQRF